MSFKEIYLRFLRHLQVELWLLHRTYPKPRVAMSFHDFPTIDGKSLSTEPESTDCEQMSVSLPPLSVRHSFSIGEITMKGQEIQVTGTTGSNCFSSIASGGEIFPERNTKLEFVFSEF